MALWQLVDLGTRFTVTHCRIALWSHQSAQTASSELRIMQIVNVSDGAAWPNPCLSDDNDNSPPWFPEGSFVSPSQTPTCSMSTARATTRQQWHETPLREPTGDYHQYHQISKHSIKPPRPTKKPWTRAGTSINWSTTHPTTPPLKRRNNANDKSYGTTRPSARMSNQTLIKDSSHSWTRAFPQVTAYEKYSTGTR